MFRYFDKVDYAIMAGFLVTIFGAGGAALWLAIRHDQLLLFLLCLLVGIIAGLPFTR